MRFGPQIKAVIVGISVIAIVLGALRLALDLFAGPGATASAPATEVTQAPDAPPIAPPAIGSLVIFAAVTIGTDRGADVAATCGGYADPRRVARAVGNVLTALVLIELAALVFAGII